MSLHKLTAGDGYTYLTQQVAAHDSTELGRTELSDYYSQKGESPGRWLGTALEDLGSVQTGSEVTEDQMKALFGEGRHPDADAMQRAAIASGMSAKQAVAATQLGRKFRSYQANTTDFLPRLKERYEQANAEAGLPHDWPLPVQDRARIRTDLGRETFVETHGRDPVDDRELSGHLARSMRPQEQSTAGYDLTFSPVKSVSTLWAIAPREVSEQIEQAQEAAVADVLGWLEREVAYTREGTDGVRQVDVTGLIAGAFTHRDSRAGDPDLHTHVAVSNKVRAADSGKWLALDGQVLYKATVAASERYNTRLEREVQARLGVDFANRDDPLQRRPVREIQGISAELLASWSTRRAQIDTRRVELAQQFQEAHGRTPTPAEVLKLAQQATLDTREAKHEPRSLADQRTAWSAQAEQVLGGPGAVNDMLTATLGAGPSPTRTPSPGDLDTAVERVREAIEASRATWQMWHVRAEAERVTRGMNVPATDADRVVQHLIDEVLHGPGSVTLTKPDGLSEPAILRRADGTSVYTKAGSAMFTSERVQAAESTLMRAARRDDGRRIDDTVVDLALLEQAANGPELNPAQTQMVRELATSGARLQLVLAPAGSGKTTAMSVLSRAWRDAGGTVVGMAPSAVAAAALRAEIDTDTDTLAKLVFSLEHGQALPEWAAAINDRSLVIIDEAGMAGTSDLAVAVDFVLSCGGSVRLVGDDQQLAAVAAGGALRDIAEEVGAVTLSQLVRFSDATEAAATLALRDGDSAAVGFYLDRGRVHVTPADGAADAVFTAWVADHDQDRTALMLAPTRELVTSLNEQARAHRMAQLDPGEVGHQVQLRDGLHASAGDQVITRRNERRLRLTGTDWVKNGDQWRVLQAHQDGSLTATHQGTARVLRLPADYVAADVSLGYASTIHGAQGLTVDACHTVVTGTESRQLLYVAMSRGRHANHVYLPAPGDGDEHGMIRPESISPATAAETLSRVIERDGAQRSARTELREQTSPHARLAQTASRFEDAVLVAALDQAGPEVRQAISDAGNTIVPGLTDAPAWEALAGKLALLSLTGNDPVQQLQAAAAVQELDTAADPAAVLHWRLGGDGPGVLAWLPAIPPVLGDHPTWGPYLNAREDLVRQAAVEVHVEATAMTPEHAPPWAAALIDHPHLLASCAVWRAAHDTPRTDRSPVGLPHPSVTHRTHQEKLEQAVLDATVIRLDGAATWKDFLRGYDDRVLSDPYWPVLAERLSIAAAAGVDINDTLASAAAKGPLPDEHAAAALWWRVNGMLAISAGVDATHGAGASRLRPPWTGHLHDLLGQDLGTRVMADAAWPQLVGAVHTSTQDGPDARALLEHAVSMIDLAKIGTPEGVPRSAVATVLTWRLTDLTSLPAEDPVPEPQVDLSTEDEQFLVDLAAEHAAAETTPPLKVTPDADNVLAPPVQEPPGDAVLEVDDPDQVPPGDDLAPVTSRDRVLQLNNQAIQAWTKAYPGSGADTYLTGRLGTDLTDDDRFPVGYAPPGWTTLVDQLREGGATDQELVDAGLGKHTRRGNLIDVFRDRLILGIQHDGDLVGFTGRANPGSDPSTPKYINTPATPAFTKGNVLYGLDSVRHDLAQGAVPVLVEGPFDAIAVTLAGDGGHVGVAPMGTALTSRQADLLGDHGTVVVATDADAAGRAAQHKAFDLLVDRSVTPAQLVLPEASDPASLPRYELTERLGESRPLMSGLIEEAAATIAAGALGGRVTIFDQVWAARNVAGRICALPTDQWEPHARHAAATLDLDPGTVMDCVVYAALDWDPVGPEPSQAPGARSLSGVENQLGPDPERHALLRARLAALGGQQQGITDEQRSGPHHEVTPPTSPGPRRGPRLG